VRLLRTSVAGLALAACLAAGCDRQERAVAAEFFEQSRLRDKTALQKVATVVYEPRVQGMVEDFQIVQVSPLEGDANQTKTVTVSARVKLPDGRIVPKTIVLTMSGGLITGFIDRAAAPVLPGGPVPRPRS